MPESGDVLLRRSGTVTAKDVAPRLWAALHAPIPGEVLFLPDPYCWYRHADVRPFMGKAEYEVRTHD